MLSNLVILSNQPQRLVLIIDELGQERIAQQFCCQLLREQGQVEATIKRLPTTGALRELTTFNGFIKECCSATPTIQPPPNNNNNNNNNNPDNNTTTTTAVTSEPTAFAHKWNIILPTLADLLCYQPAAVIFQFLHELRRCPHIRRTLLWASTQHIERPAYMVAACEYMADLVVHLRSDRDLSIVTRKPSGGVTNRKYTYKSEKLKLIVQELKTRKGSPPGGLSTDATAVKPAEQLGTFKIELEEEEMVARNALKLPYEKTSTEASVGGGGHIIYTPEAADDFDDEDPDEDLCI